MTSIAYFIISGIIVSSFNIEEYKEYIGKVGIVSKIIIIILSIIFGFVLGPIELPTIIGVILHKQFKKQEYETNSNNISRNN